MQHLSVGRAEFENKFSPFLLRYPRWPLLKLLGMLEMGFFQFLTVKQKMQSLTFEVQFLTFEHFENYKPSHAI